MSVHAQLLIAVWFSGICALSVVAFLCWLGNQLFWDLFDLCMQHYKRCRNGRRFQCRVGQVFKGRLS